VAPFSYTGYPGFGHNTVSPGFIKALAILATPSFPPI